MAFHDHICPKCGLVRKNVKYNPEGPDICPRCRFQTEILWTSDHKHNAAVHEKERAVVWRNKKTGKIVYPGRNDIPVPERYSRKGFERVEFGTLRDIHAFEKEVGVKSEVAWYDRGTGRGFDDASPRLPGEFRAK